MNITKEQADKVIAALEKAGAAKLADGTYLDNDCSITIALSIMRGLADAEPVAYSSPEHCERFPFCGCFSGCDDDDTSPQAAQTALKSESSAQAAQALAQPPSEGKTIEALAPTEAQEREAFEAFMLTKYPAHLCHWVGDQYSEMFTRLVFVGWKAGRAGSKP